MNRYQASIIFTCMLLVGGVRTAWPAVDDEDKLPAGEYSHHLREAAKYRLELDNDAFVSSDNQFSSGWSLQYHSAIADDWRSLKTPVKWLTKPGAHLPGLQSDALKKRFNMSVRQIIQTPARLSERERILDDVPYAAVIALQTSWIAYNDSELRGFEVSVGLVGPAALGEPSQNFGHRLAGINEARGWDNQLNTEPVFNVNYMRKKKFPDYPQTSASFRSRAGIGGVRRAA